MDAATWLDAWDRGRDQPAALRPISLLSVEQMGETPEALARLPVGERDRRLLQLREALFGRTMDALARCPACGTDLEFELDGPTLAGTRTPPGETTFAVEVDRCALRVRVLDSFDLVAAARQPDVAGARRELARRAIVSACRCGATIDVDDLPSTALVAVEEKLAEHDPQGAIELDLTCPACAARWSPLFDIATFLWSELDRWAACTLDDIHTLAAAYGWTEATILALPHARRASYLARIRGAA